MTYKVTHYAYCGMSIPLGNGYTHAEARGRFERRIGWFEEMFDGEVMREGLNRAELCEPDNSMLVPDECGILRIEKGEQLKRLTLERLIDLVKHGFRVEVKVLLLAGLFSQHEVSLDGNTVTDFSYVDSTVTYYTLREFKKQSVVAKAARMNNLIFERKRSL